MCEPVRVSVLVPVFDEERHIASAVARMLEQELDGQAELIFIDGRSQDRTRTILEKFQCEHPRLVVLDNAARRTPNGLNVGLAAARGEFVCRMDAHTLYPPQYLADGIARLEQGDVAWVAGPQLPRGDGRWSRRVALALTSSLGTGQARFRQESDEEFDTDSGFTGLWRRSTLTAYGGWDEGWPVNQDGELAARIRADGGRIVCVPAMAAEYIPRDSLNALARQYFRYGSYKTKTLGRHPETMRSSQLLPPMLLGSCLAVAAPVAGIRRLGRLALAVYATAVGTAAMSKVRAAGVLDAAAVPAVLATMHLAWALGVVRGCTRFGVPWRALQHVVKALRP